MDTDELALLDRAVRHALGATDSDTGTDEALDEMGWHDVLTAEPRDAVSVVFTALGDLNAGASSLDDVMLQAFGGDPATLGASLALSAFTGWEPPGTYDGELLALDGVALPRVAHRESLVVPARDGAGMVLATVATDTVSQVVVDGLDPRLGLRRIFWCCQVLHHV